MNLKNIFLVLVVLLFNACSEEDKTVEKEKVKIVKIFDIKNGSNIKEKFEFPAQIEALQDTLMAFEVPGKIVEFYFSEGDNVKKGDVIAKLDDVIYKANLDSAKANYEQAINDFNRYELLLKTKSVSQAAYEKYKQNLDVTKAAYEVARKNFEETKLRAEFDGIVAKKLLNDFARVTAKQPIVRVQDTSSYKVNFYVPEMYMLKMKGDLTSQSISKFLEIFVLVGSDDKDRFKAKLIDIATTADKITRTFETTLEMQKQENITILPGMTAKVQIVVKTDNQRKIFIPFQAVFTDESRNSLVWVVNDENLVVKQQIELGKVLGKYVEVTAGLNESKKIVTSGIRFLKENDKVQQYKQMDE